MQLTADPTALRKRLLANGYTPLPNIGKACFMTGWPRLEVTEETIEEWGRRHRRYPDTGLRVEHGLAVLDLDIDHEVMDNVAARLEETQPALAQALLRRGKGHKEAWFLRTSEPFSRIHTRRWLAPGADIDTGAVVSVEAFGGAAARQFGAFGAHTREPDGTALIEYRWDGPSPLDRRLDELPEWSKAEAFTACDAVEGVLESLGWTVVPLSQRGESEAVREYDLDRHMQFECNDGITRSLDDLQRSASEGLRCSASWLEPGGKHSLTRCLIGLARNGMVTIWDSASAVTHCPVERATTAADNRDADVTRLAERLRELKDRRLAKLSSEDSCLIAAGKMLQAYAFCPNQVNGVVPVWAESINDGMTMTAFRHMLTPWSEIEIGPRGGEKRINPADLWLASAQRRTVGGLRLRPDMARPVYEEADHQQWVNIYAPIVHSAVDGGSIDVGLELMEQLLPSPFERHYFLQWLAYKYRNPTIPGPGVLMVAREHGTGRGTLGELVMRLFGQRYVKTLPFDIFAGRTYQSQYNSWGADCLFVLVNESSDASNGQSTYSAKRDTYEKLKDLVDPRPIVRHFVVHGKTAFDAPGYTSYIIATNHADALPLPADDRRFAVLTNGEPRELAFWQRVNAWLEQPASIAAFAKYLGDYDITGYSPFAVPPMTDAKLAMTELATSDLDKAFDAAVVELPARIVTAEQVIEAMRAAVDTYGYQFPDRWQTLARRMIAVRLHRVGVPHGKNWLPQIDNKRHAVYARDPRTAAGWTEADIHEVRREAARNDKPSSGQPGTNVIRGLFRGNQETGK